MILLLVFFTSLGVGAKVGRVQGEFCRLPASEYGKRALNADPHWGGLTGMQLKVQRLGGHGRVDALPSVQHLEPDASQPGR
jgi:hypothetical protein